MDPSEVDSSQDVRDGWDSWSYSERVEALNQLANEILDQYGYEDDVDVDTGAAAGRLGYYDDGSIIMVPSQIEDPNPEEAIDTVNHETVHAMNDQDGIEDYRYPEDFDFEEGDLEVFIEHGKIDDVARELDRDGFPPPAGGGGGGGGGGSASSARAGESGSGPDEPKSADLEFEIDWAQGVWIDSVDESGNMSVDIMFAAPEGW